MTWLQRSLHVAARFLAPLFSRAFDTPLRTVRSLLPPGVCYRALRCLPGRIFHPLEQRVFQDAPCFQDMLALTNKAAALSYWPVARTDDSGTMKAFNTRLSISRSCSWLKSAGKPSRDARKRSRSIPSSIPISADRTA
jgi:hypothetical protein